MMMPNPMMGMLGQLKANPVQFLMQRRINLPQGVNMNDPQAIINALVQSGRVNQEQINAAYSMMQRMGR